MNDDNKILDIKYDANLIQNLHNKYIKDYGNLYYLKNKLIKVKHTRGDSKMINEVRVNSN